MDANKGHITEITRKDLAEIAGAANMYPGAGIAISRNQDGNEIKIDRDQLTRWVKTIMNGGTI